MKGVGNDWPARFGFILAPTHGGKTMIALSWMTNKSKVLNCVGRNEFIRAIQYGRNLNTNIWRMLVGELKQFINLCSLYSPDWACLLWKHYFLFLRKMGTNAFGLYFFFLLFLSFISQHHQLLLQMAKAATNLTPFLCRRTRKCL